jgi:endonuclease/exonuclease/phosphatase family metal-dependent hydrolase
MPAVVGVQEAARIRVQRPSDYVGGSRPNATDEEFDFLTALREGLDAARREQGRSLGYRVAAVVSTTDEEFPAQPPDGERFDVRLTDRTALFVREDLSVTATEADTYATAIDGQIDDGTRVTVRRGYALAELDLGGLPTTVVTTHLEGSVRFIRHAQAAELRAVLEERTGPVVVTGDFNSGPQAGEGSAYEGFLEEYDDAWDGDEAGHTCCQWANLRNRRSLLRRRIDHVLYRGAVEPQRVWRTGEDPEARIETDTAAEMVWPSNHAGVVADLWLPTAGTDPLGVGRRVLARYAGRPSR